MINGFNYSVSQSRFFIFYFVVITWYTVRWLATPMLLFLADQQTMHTKQRIFQYTSFFHPALLFIFWSNWVKFGQRLRTSKEHYDYYKISMGRMEPTVMCALATVPLMEQNDILCVGPRQLWAHRGRLVWLMRLEREVRDDSQSK